MAENIVRTLFSEELVMTDNPNENPEILNENKSENDRQDQPLKFENNREVLLFLFIMIKENKKWWLLPMLAVLAILSLFASLTGNASVLPAIYALF